MKRNNSAASKAKYYLNSEGQFIIENYNCAKLFTSFFPGIAGLWGIPMWVFYVNRGQCITSFGIEAKDKAILEFQPANKAYRLTSLYGFRTFLKIQDGSKNLFYEPFQNHLHHSSFQVKQHMAVTSHDLTIEETNLTLGLRIKVNYFTLPEEPFAALVRRVTIKNIHRQKRLHVEFIDGMPVIVPFGLSDGLLKNMSRTAEAWSQVSNLENKAPYFNLRVAIADTSQVTPIDGGNFYFSFDPQKTKENLLTSLVRPSCIFGTSTDLVYPEAFLRERHFKLPGEQNTNKKTPCAMSFTSFSLPPQAQKEIISLAGHCPSQACLTGIVGKTTSLGYINQKAKRNKEIIDEIKNCLFTVSASREFDMYCGQTFLDNVMRGGLPVSVTTSRGKEVFNVFSRKHGDPERDYNYFVINTTYLSCGNGNYRDVNQNRRNDVWFNGDVKADTIVNFLNLTGADGYNPLIIKGTMFTVEDRQKIGTLLNTSVDKNDRISLERLLEKDFLAGKLLSAIEQKNIRLKIAPQEFLKQLLVHCRKCETAEHGEGFWSDHWTYNLDLIESFLSVYPEEKRSILFEKNIFSFYHDSFYVLPRHKRYILTEGGCRQRHAVAKATVQVKVDTEAHKLKAQGGRGPVYLTNLFVKLLCLVANKAATLDPSGIGVEMEADKPNWYDALNGLPGLFGSSISEALELKRLCLFLLESLNGLALEDKTEIKIFEELFTFVMDLNEALVSCPDAYSYWDRSNQIKEGYRECTRAGIAGEEKGLSITRIKEFLTHVAAKLDCGIALAKNQNGTLTTYFTHEVTAHEVLNTHTPSGISYIRPLAFRRRVLPLFLEGFVHALKVEKDKTEVKRLYAAIRRSPLFDKKLKMYKVNANLSGESEEIGRTRIFPRGWLENESIWLHMEYKFLLELLRAGLYKEFFENFKHALIPFLNAERYGRSTLENSSFIVSSAHEDAGLYGRGFVARLSGTTAEFLHIWRIMNVGQRPFYLDENGKLALILRPILPGWLFTKNKVTVDYFDKRRGWQKITFPPDSYAFNFLNSTLVVYHNPPRYDTFTKGAAKNIFLHYADGKRVPVSSEILSSPLADHIRSGRVERIEVTWS